MKSSSKKCGIPSSVGRTRMRASESERSRKIIEEIMALVKNVHLHIEEAQLTPNGL